MWAPPGPGGWDRGRVGARLRAALAGLHELQGLRARQQARVRGALGLQPPAAAPPPAARRLPGAQEQRLEAALDALQEQLNRLRHQDVGLKSHLDQLGQHISKLQLDTLGTGEAADGDSRPSSGFYELSDGGSGSLSASCASVSSGRAASPAREPARGPPRDRRPRSADAGAVGGASPGAAPRPRPVSAGDLDRGRPAEGLQEASADPGPWPLLGASGGLPSPALDPRFRRDLVSRGGSEVYPYPSPLHAVALQSPLFALSKETPKSGPCSPPGQPLSGPAGPGSGRLGPTLEAGQAGAYIDRLLRLRARGGPPEGGAGQQGPPGPETPPAPPEPRGQGAAGGGGSGLASVGGGGAAPGRGLPLQQRGHALPPAPGPLRPGSLPGERPQPSGGRVPGETLPGCPRPEAAPPAAHGLAGRPTLRCREPGNPAPSSPAPPPGPGAPSARLKAGPPAPTAERARLRASGKAPRPGRPLPWGAAPAGPRPPAGWGAGARRRPGEAPGRSCSEASLYPVSVFVPLLVASRGHPRTWTQALLPVAAGPEPGRKRRRWRSSLEISAPARPPAGPEPSRGPPGPAVRGGGGPPPACARAGPRRSPRAGSKPDRSERLAARPSPPPATVAEASEDRARGRPGGQGSGGAEGGPWGLGGRPAWPRAAPRPPPPPSPGPGRIKASRALRKKLRRLQPAAMTVMTLV